jgi:hypothetical protein
MPTNNSTIILQKIHFLRRSNLAAQQFGRGFWPFLPDGRERKFQSNLQKIPIKIANSY